MVAFDDEPRFPDNESSERKWLEAVVGADDDESIESMDVSELIRPVSPIVGLRCRSICEEEGLE